MLLSAPRCCFSHASRLGAEQRPARLRVDEHVRLLVMLDLQQEVLGLFQVVAEGLLPLLAGPAALGAVADHPRVRALVPVAAVAALDDAGHAGHASWFWSHSSTCRSRNRRCRPT